VAVQKSNLRADRSGAVLIFGSVGKQKPNGQLKWMASKEQQAIAQADLLKMTDELRQQLNAFF